MEASDEPEEDLPQPETEDLREMRLSAHWESLERAIALASASRYHEETTFYIGLANVHATLINAKINDVIVQEPVRG